MQLKHLFVSLLAFGSAIATPNPVADNDGGIEARGTSSKSCPSNMYWSKSQNKCACSPGYYGSGSQCKPTCGSDGSAYWSTKSNACVCKNTALKFNTSSKKCDCGTGKTWDSYNRKCIKSCGQGASLNRWGQCTCSTPGQTYDSTYKKCVSVCKDGSSYKNGKCVCPKSGWTYSTYSKKCSPPKCASGATWTDGRCKCSKANYDYTNSKCVLNCGSEATAKGDTCVCKIGTKTFDSATKSCSCPSNTEWNRSAWKCVEKCGTSAHWSTSRNACVCNDSGKTFSNGVCSCGTDEEYKNGACTPKCGDDAWWNKDKQRCICQDEGKTYDKTNGCGCYGDDEKYDSRAKACVPNCGSSATYRQGGCKCNESGLIYNKDDKTCNAPNCPKNAEYVKADGTNPATCRCTRDDQKYDESSRQCVSRCPKKSYWESNKCRCNNENHVVRDDICQCPLGTSPDKSNANRCTPDCKDGASWSHSENACVCKGEGTEYKNDLCTCASGYVLGIDEKTCEPKCPSPSSYWDKDECKCTNSQFKFYAEDNDGKGACRCPDGFASDGPGGKYCTPDCGKYAKYDSKAESCECLKDNTVFSKKGEPCACKDGYQEDGTGDCKLICPSKSTYVPAKDGKDATCKCSGDLVYDKDSDRCKEKCPESAKVVAGENDEYTCECLDISEKFENGKCKPKCPGQTTYVPEKGTDKETCKCNNSRKTWDGTSCTNTCPSGADPVEGVCRCRDQSKKIVDNSCVEKCPEDSHYVPAKTSPAKPETCSCKNQNFDYKNGECGCPSGTVAYGKDDQFCRPESCGDYADFSESRKECVCKKENADFKDNTCTCKKGYVEDDTEDKNCVPSCPDNADYVEATKSTEATCKCHNTQLDYVDKECKCPDNTKLWGSICKADCPKGSSLDKSKKPYTCKCDIEGADFSTVEADKGACKCPSGERVDGSQDKCVACPTGSTVTDNGKSCKCDVGKFKSDLNECRCDNGEKPVGGKCQANCGSIAFPTDAGTCKCNIDHAIFKEGPPKTCECPKGAKKQRKPNSTGKECVCDDSVLEGSVFHENGLSCVCPPTFIPDDAGTKCVPDCDKDSEVVSSDGKTCECNEITHHLVGTECVKRCFDKEPRVIKKLIEERSQPEECYCDEESGDYQRLLNGGLCVEVCEKEHEKLDPSKSERTCICETGYGRVDGECLEKCDPEITPTKLRKRTNVDPQTCFCEEDEHYDDGHCRPICTENEKISEHNCFCDISKPDLEVYNGFCVKPCTVEHQTHDTEINDFKCICDEGSNHPSGSLDGGDLKCTPLCGQGKPITSSCFCDTEGDEAKYEETEDGHCAKKCEIENQTHDPENDDKCFCDESLGKLKELENGNVCSKVCTNGEEIGDCYCPTTGSGATYEVFTFNQKSYCVEKCKDGKLHKPSKPEECECPELTHFTVGSTCKRRCNDGEKTNEGNTCYCDHTPSSKFDLVRDYCVKKCPDKSVFSTSGFPACVCNFPNVQDTSRSNRCLAKCGNNDIFQGGSVDCFCDTEKPGPEKQEKVGNYCRKVCPEAEVRIDNAVTCSCKPGATRPGMSGNSPCSCPTGASAKDKTKCECTMNGKFLRDGGCRSACPGFATYDEVNFTCKCKESGKNWHPSGDGGNCY